MAITVAVAEGALRGARTRTKAGTAFFSFLGVPYASPPVGPLRFKPPKPPQRWTGIREALCLGNPCPQIDAITQQFAGDEDCLYLNVFSPQLPANSSGGNLLPVMVWIHGGGFTFGSGTTDLYSPDFLVERGVVVVTINYRLNIFGFLSTEDEVVPGNMGLKDQVAALRWVRTNIANFGGNPNNVTVFGESAGGASVHYLILSPMGKGLFHKAISQSGSAFNVWAFTKCARQRAFRFGSALGCNASDSKQLVQFLNNVPAKQLVETLYKALDPEEQKERFELPFMPTVEPSVGDCENFLPRHPEELASSNNIQHVPYITGCNSHEGYFLLLEFIQRPELLSRLNSTFQRLIPNNIDAKRGSLKSMEISRKVKKFYFGEEDLSEETLPKFVDLRTDIYFSHGIHRAAERYLEMSNSPVYRYLFSYSGGLNVSKLMMGAGHMPGASHADDISYLFRMTINDVDIDPDSDDARTIRRMTRMWTDFAKTGNPTPCPNSEIPVTWPRSSNASPSYLEIGSELVLHQGHILQQRVSFWDELYNKDNAKL